MASPPHVNQNVIHLLFPYTYFPSPRKCAHFSILFVHQRNLHWTLSKYYAYRLDNLCINAQIPYKLHSTQTSLQNQQWTAENWLQSQCLGGGGGQQRRRNPFMANSKYTQSLLTFWNKIVTISQRKWAHRQAFPKCIWPHSDTATRARPLSTQFLLMFLQL